MEFKLPHKTTRFEAVQKIKTTLQEARAKMGNEATITEERWEGDTLFFAVTIQGQNISGQLAITDTDYEIDVKLPLMLRLFEGKIKQAIEAQASQLLKG
jgi:hypothetical protein